MDRDGKLLGSTLGCVDEEGVLLGSELGFDDNDGEVDGRNVATGAIGGAGGLSGFGSRDGTCEGTALVS